jgi:hypothetical protein
MATRPLVLGRPTKVSRKFSGLSGKPYWDDYLRHNPKLRVILSGSSPSFIVSQLLSTSAMYNRSNHMLELKPFEPGEIREYLQKGPRETLLATIAFGGIPEYLKQIKHSASVYLGLCERSYRPGEFLSKDGVGKTKP